MNNKKLLVFITPIIAVIMASILYLVGTSPDATTTDQQAPSAANSPAQPSSPSPAGSGKYIDYTDEAFAMSEGTRLLFFHAPWCPQCRQLESDIQANGVPEGVTIFKVDYDSSQSLRQKYGVTLQTTVVRVDAQGNLDKKFVAYDDPTLASIKTNLLP